MLMVQALLCRYVSMHSPPASLELRGHRVEIFSLIGRPQRNSFQIPQGKRRSGKIHAFGTMECGTSTFYCI